MNSFLYILFIINVKKAKIITILLFFSICSLKYFDKHFTIKICVCTCGKNENKYVREFVEHYKKYGVDKIFIYDNNDEKGEKFQVILSDYIKTGFVKIINYRNKIRIQMLSFNHCYQKNKNNYDWFIFYDIDEFIYINKYKSIKEYLNRNNFMKCNIIYLNHVIHTDNNQIYYQNFSLFERFPEIENYQNINISYKPRRVLQDLTKIIIRGNLKNINFNNPHFVNDNLNKSCNGFGKIINHKGIHLYKPS